MALAQPREGEALTVMKRELEFSYFMMRRTTRRWGLNSMLYAAEPWAVIGGSVTDEVRAGDERQAALSFVRQAREYYGAAERASAIETRPLLYYYSFLNLGKALSITRGRAGLVGKVHHGVVDKSTSGHTLASALLAIRRSSISLVSALDELHHALEGAPAPSTPGPGYLPVREMIPQSVVGHRLWREAAGRKERFLAVQHVSLMHDASAKAIWATVHVREDTMVARGRGTKETLQQSGLSVLFRPVADHTVLGHVCRSFEQRRPIRYTGRPGDAVMDLVTALRTLLWQTVTSGAPYRRYFLYLCPPGEHRYPQWLTAYCVLFWLGSLTRYQPVSLLQILDGPYGPFFREFLETQPAQLLYVLASEFKQQDVSRAGIV